MNPLKAIVIGASSGIGRAVAKELSGRGYEVGIMARRLDLLKELQKEITTKSYLHAVDLKQADRAIAAFKSLIQEMGGLDLVVINSGINHPNLELDWSLELETIQVNVAGFTAMADTACRFFLKQGHGHIAAVSSISGVRGSGRSPAYSASKAYMSIYLDGLRQRTSRTDITVTDIRPGFVDTAMLEGRKNVFWAATPETAARQICDAIKEKRRVVYVTKRWRYVVWLLRRLPESWYDWGYWKFIEHDLRRKSQGTK